MSNSFELRIIESLGVMVSNTGLVFKKKGSGYIPAHQVDCSGYKNVSLRINGEQRTIGVHRLVAMAFVPKPKNKNVVNHIDGNKSNNNSINLEWVTISENHDHALRTGLVKYKKCPLCGGRMTRKSILCCKCRTDIGAKLRFMRMNYNLRTKQVSEYTGIPEHIISRAEYGRADQTPEIILKLRALYECPAEHIIL